MFKRKLTALEYHDAEKFNIDGGILPHGSTKPFQFVCGFFPDEKQFRSLILWLEEQKIRHYKIEDREDLRKTDSDKWLKTLGQYFNDLNCPIKCKNNVEILGWLLGEAIRYEYEDNLDKFSELKSEDIAQKTLGQPKVISSNPLDCIDFDSKEFKTGVNKLAQVLKIIPHPNHLITLHAISKLIKERLSEQALKNPDSVIHKGTPFPYQSVDEGFDIGDVAVNNATKMFRLLFLNDLRSLQTHINECIVNVQNLTANPKTDTKLGKVGR